MSVKCIKCATKIFGEKKEGDKMTCPKCHIHLVMKVVRFGTGPFDVELRVCEVVP